MNHSRKAIIIGAGVAGLASAIRLAVQGYKVAVFEKNAYPGGKLGHFTVKGYQFDAGPSLFTQPQNIEELFTLAGEPMEDYFSYRSMPVACKYFYEDGTELNACTGAEKFAKEVAAKLGEDEDKLKTYLSQSEKLYNSAGSVFLNYSLHKKSTLTRSPLIKAFATVKGKHLFKSLHRLNTEHFTKEKTVQLFNRYATYNGSNPYQAPGMLSLIPHLELNEGTFYPEGGMISITRALYQLAIKKGVSFYFDTAVQRIIEHKKKVRGIVANDESYDADMVVSNVDVYFTYQHLLLNEKRAQKILQQERSSSALVFYWGMKKEFPQLDLHNIFFSASYKEEFDHIFRYKNLSADPTVYINITSKCEPGIQAPEGKENWFVMVNTPANTGQDWGRLKQQCRANVIHKLNRLLQTDIEPLMDVEETLDPLTIESKTASYMGSIYGASSNSKMAAFRRHPNFTDAVKGLYFVGGTVHPGGGIPLCLQSAKIMSGIVKETYKN